MREKKYRAAILGYYGFGNLGDDLLLEACLAMFKRCGVSREEVIVLTNAPEGSDGPAVNRWRMSEVVRALRESETLLLGGGGLFQDSTSVKSCVWYWCMVKLAKMLGSKVWAIGQSVGPLRSRVGRMLAGNALRECEVVQVRDEGSYERALEFGCRRVILGTDIVMTMGGEEVSGVAEGQSVSESLRLRGIGEDTGVTEGQLLTEAIRLPRMAEDTGVPEGLSLTEALRLRGISEATGVPEGLSLTEATGMTKAQSDCNAQQYPYLSSTAATAPTHPPAAAAYSLINLRPSPLLDLFIPLISPHINSLSIGAALSDEDIPPLQKLGLSSIVRVSNLHEAAALWSNASWTIGMRLHFGVLSRIFRKPLALLPYDPKISAFAHQSSVPCITDHWLQPLLPLPVPENPALQIDAICREILAL